MIEAYTYSPMVEMLLSLVALMVTGVTLWVIGYALKQLFWPHDRLEIIAANKKLAEKHRGRKDVGP